MNENQIVWLLYAHLHVSKTWIYDENVFVWLRHIKFILKHINNIDNFLCCVQAASNAGSRTHIYTKSLLYSICIHFDGRFSQALSIVLFQLNLTFLHSFEHKHKICNIQTPATSTCGVQANTLRKLNKTLTWSSREERETENDFLLFCLCID